MPTHTEVPWSAGTATGIGSLPYDDPVEAMRIVLGELPDLPHLPELPGRGPGADVIGRACGLLVDLAVDLQPAGWRLTSGEGQDQRRSRSMLAHDLDAVEELAGAYAGPFKLQVAGPWTLAACLERPRGGRVLGDRGARRDVAQSLAEGLAAHVTGLRRRVPGAVPVVQLDEPSITGVLRGSIPTASGFSRYRSVEEPEVVELLAEVIGRVAGDGAVPVVHCCASGVPFTAMVRAGARGLSFDLAHIDDTADDALAEAVERGVVLFVGAVPSRRPPLGPRGNRRAAPTDAEIAKAVAALWHRLGFDPDDVAAGCVITPSCGLAGADPDWVRTALKLSRTAGAALTDLT
ncbi:MAG TPA: methionine synthase [Actinopolymorphaceae bacterium]|nr:methionine synthase [Actinopolymorphaceae bacterium]